MEMLDYPFMRLSLLLGLVLGTLFSLMGIFIVTKGMAFFSDFIAHASLLGITVALAAGIEPTVFLVFYSITIGLIASAVWNRFQLSRDTVLGSLHGGLLAAGIILASVKGLGMSGILKVLFGDILLINKVDLWLSLGMLAAFSAFLYMNLNKLLKSSFLPEISRAEGLNTRLYDYLLIIMIAVTISLSIKITGALLANAMVVIPAASAKTISRNFRQFVITAPLMGVFSFTTGIIVSFYIDIPSGPSVIAIAFALFIVCLGIKAIRG